MCITPFDCSNGCTRNWINLSTPDKCQIHPYVFVQPRERAADRMHAVNSAQSVVVGWTEKSGQLITQVTISLLAIVIMFEGLLLPFCFHCRLSTLANIKLYRDEGPVIYQLSDMVKGNIHVDDDFVAIIGINVWNKIMYRENWELKESLLLVLWNVKLKLDILVNNTQSLPFLWALPTISMSREVNWQLYNILRLSIVSTNFTLPSYCRFNLTRRSPLYTLLP